jgi:hypothetical protein
MSIARRGRLAADVIAIDGEDAALCRRSDVAHGVGQAHVYSVSRGLLLQLGERRRQILREMALRRSSIRPSDGWQS